MNRIKIQASKGKKTHTENTHYLNSILVGLQNTFMNSKVSVPSYN